MKLPAVCLFSALYAAASTLASDLQPTIPSVSEEAAPEPTGLTAEHYEVLEARQAAHDPNVGGVDVPTQFPTVTTDWRPTLVGGVKTWYPDIYTQTFAKVPDQLPSPGVGKIGLGNLTKKNGKRAAEATPTGAVALVLPEDTELIAEPVVMIMQTTIIVQPIQRVTEVQIIETVVETATVSSRNNATRPSASFRPSGSGVFLGTGTTPWATGSHGSAVSGMLPVPYNDSEPWSKRFL